MTVAALPPSIDYIENGVTLSFAAPFRFLAGTIEVLRSIVVAELVTTVPLSAGTDYTTSGGATDAGGMVTLAATVAGARLRIRRRTPRSQPMSYTVGDRFPAESHEHALDRDMLVSQELDDALGDLDKRSVQVGQGEAGMTLPALSARARRLPVWDVAGAFRAQVNALNDTAVLTLSPDGVPVPMLAAALYKTSPSVADFDGGFDGLVGGDAFDGGFDSAI